MEEILLTNINGVIDRDLVDQLDPETVNAAKQMGYSEADAYQIAAVSIWLSTNGLEWTKDVKQLLGL